MASDIRRICLQQVVLFSSWMEIKLQHW